MTYNLWKNSIQNKKLKPAILAIDIGGSSTSYGLIPLEDFISNKNCPLILIKNIPTIKGKNNIKNIIINIIEKSISKSIKLGYFIYPHIFIGSPGRFIGPNLNTIAKQSATNLESYPREFDNLNLYNLIKEFLPNWASITIKNDAIAQMKGSIYLLLKNKKYNYLINSKVAYIGPGTGLGGGFCFIEKDSHINVRTDGHICDIMIRDINDVPTRIEDVLSGIAFKKATGKTPKEVNEDPVLLEKYLSEIVLMGNYLSQIIQKIYYGDIEKHNSKNNWSKLDLNLVKGTSHFLIGGSIGTKGTIGKTIIKQAKVDLKKNNLSNVKLIPIPHSEKAAVIGTASFILDCA
jgi:hypothetical protein